MRMCCTIRCSSPRGGPEGSQDEIFGVKADFKAASVASALLPCWRVNDAGKITYIIDIWCLTWLNQ